MELSRADKPPKKDETLWVVSPKGNERLKFIVYSPAVMGVHCHWTGRRTVPCFENQDLCEGGHKDATQKWRGYVHAWAYDLGRQVFVQLTGEAVESWWAQCGPGVSLRGQIVEVIRTQKNNGRLTVQVDKYLTREKDKLPEPRDCKLSLFKLWGVRPSIEEVRASLCTCTEEIPEAAYNRGVA